MSSNPAESDPALWRELRTSQGRALVARLTPWQDEWALSVLAEIRRDPQWASRPEVVAAAASQARLRTRAAARFPGPSRWWTENGLEQATRDVVARRRAARFAQSGVSEVADLGCGVGSDALAMAAAGIQVDAVDQDPAALSALAATAEDWGLKISTQCLDVTSHGWWLGTSGGKTRGCFVDPARRSPKGRAMSPRDWSPTWEWVQGLARRVPSTGAKVAPGIAHGEIPPDAQTEWISVGGDLVETSVWWGPLRRGLSRRSAILIPKNSSETGGDLAESNSELSLDDSHGIPRAAVGPVGSWIAEPDPAVLRAGLVSLLSEQFGGHLLDPRIAYITGDSAVPDSPWVSTFDVLDEVPFARKQLRKWLRERGYSNVVVKKRGLDLVPEQLRSDLALRGDGPTATLLMTRTDNGPLALLVQRR